MKNNHPGSNGSKSPRSNRTTRLTRGQTPDRTTEAQPLRIFVESQITNGGRKWRMGAGLLVEFLLLAAVLAVPLYLTEQMDTKEKIVHGTPIWIPSPPPEGNPDADPNNPHKGNPDAQVPVRERRPNFPNQDSPLLPVGDPKPVVDLHDADWDPSAGDVPWGVPGGIGKPGQGIPNGIGFGGPPPPVVPVIPGGEVDAPRLLRQVRPDYPRIAQKANIEGNVVFDAVLGTDGRVQQLAFVGGHPLLREAARKAVLQWVYQPTHLNGRPVAVRMNITVKFRLRR
jgi:protein TonB